MKQPGNPLGKIIRSFKARSTHEIHEAEDSGFTWQRNYYDHIIRSDIDHFFIEEYIRLNPLMWSIDSDNPTIRSIPIQDLRNYLRAEFGLEGYALERILRHEMAYRSWSDNTSSRDL